MSTQRIHSEGNCYLLGKKNGIEKCYCHSGFYFLFYVVWGSLKNKSWKLFRFFTGDMNWPVKMSLLKFSAQVTWGVTNRCKQQCCLRAESALVWLGSGVVFFPVICFIGRSWAWISRWQVNCSSHSCSSSPSRVLKGSDSQGACLAPPLRACDCSRQSKRLFVLGFPPVDGLFSVCSEFTALWTSIVLQIKTQEDSVGTDGYKQLCTESPLKTKLVLWCLYRGKSQCGCTHQLDL